MEEKRESAPTQVVYLPPSMIPVEEELDILALGRALWRKKWLISGFTLLCTLVAVWVSLVYLPVMYRSDAVVQPRDRSDELSSLGALSEGISNLGISLPLGSMGGLLGGKKKSEFIYDFVTSRTLKEKIMRKYNLLPRIYWRKWDEEKKRWKSTLWQKISFDKKTPTTTIAIQKEDIDDFYEVERDRKSGLITVSYLDKDPELAARVVSGVLKELKYYLDHDYVSDAKRVRIFVAEQLKRAKKELEYWERQIPDQRHTERSILRELKASLVVYTELRKQYELARIQEARDIIAFKVLDPALVPEKKAKPKRTIICGVTLAASFLVAILFAVAFETLVGVKKRSEESG